MRQCKYPSHQKKDDSLHGIHDNFMSVPINLHKQIGNFVNMSTKMLWLEVLTAIQLWPLYGRGLQLYEDFSKLLYIGVIPKCVSQIYPCLNIQAGVSKALYKTNYTKELEIYLNILKIEIKNIWHLSMTYRILKDIMNGLYKLPT